ncbi:MAG: carbonic anhydrase [Prevotella sp.]|nr:carbonic anhydrase [Prevotella sp.]
MNYKKIIKSQQLRFKILRLLSWVPDSVMLRIQYRIKMGIWPDFKHPKRFTEKLQLYKMKYRNPVMPQCVDKYEVRKYIEKKGLSDTLVNLYGVWDNANDIDFNSLPNSFILKTTNGGGGENVIIVSDKANEDTESIKKRLDSWLNKNSGNAGREWAYTGIKKSRIIAEGLLINEKCPEAGIEDFKIFCFDGKPFCVQVDSGRFESHHQNFYDMEWKSLGVHCTYPEGEGIDKPTGFDEMKRLASRLSADFPFVRVDLYNVGGKTYFGELTFYPSSGYGKFTPDDFDFELGSYFTEY